MLVRVRKHAQESESDLEEDEAEADKTKQKALKMSQAKREKIKEETDPGECRKLGRMVHGFDQNVWDDNIKMVAYEVLRQKFESDEGLKALLLDTGDDGKTL